MSTGKRPDADTVSGSTEEITDTSNFFESGIFGQNISNLVHGCTPAESLVEVIKYFYSIGTTSFCEKFVHFLTKSLGSTHAFTSKLRRCTCRQAFVLVRGRQVPVDCNPLACTNAPSFGLLGRLVAISEAKVTTLFCCNFCCCIEISSVGLPMNKRRSLEMNVNLK